MAEVTTPKLYEKILYSAEEVSQRIDEMASEIIDTYDSDVLFVALMNGALPFASQLMRSIAEQDPNFNPNMQAMIVSRYGDERTGTEPKLVTDLPPKYRNLTDRCVVLLDDLFDEGGTIKFTEEHLRGYGAEVVDKIVLVKKLKQPTTETDLAMVGFTTPDVWLTGMGMDDSRLGDEGNRWAPWIAQALGNE